MTELSALDILRHPQSGDESDIKAAIECAISALEKQIPKKPDLEGDGYDDSGELVYDTGYCPDCKHEFEVYYDATKYCPNCGQHLDWSNIEDLGI